MTDTFSGIIRIFGRKITCYGRDGQELGGGMAVVQPMTAVEWQSSAGALGSFSTHRFRCLAEPGTPLNEGDTVLWSGSRYEVMNVRPIWVGDQTTHLWAALRPWEEDEET